MGEVASLCDRRRRRDVEARMAEMEARGFMSPVDVSDLSTDIDAVLAELTAYTGIRVERIAPITAAATPAGNDNVVALHAFGTPADPEGI